MSESIRAVERALDVLMCFSRNTPELTMTQIAEQIGINKSTVHRLLATLEKKRFVQRDPVSGVYRPGIRVLQMAYLTLEQNDLRRQAAPFLQRLRDQHRETVDLAVLDNADVVYLDVLESPQRLKLAAAIGQRLPACCTASGKALLAFMSEEAVQRILDNGVTEPTEQKALAHEAFFEDLRNVHARGFAISEQEYEAGINAVAAPVFDASDRPIASIAIAGPTFRLPRERMEEIGPTIVATAREIALEMDAGSAPHERPFSQEPNTESVREERGSPIVRG